MQQRRGVQVDFLGVGAAFVAVAILADQPSMLGVGMAFVGPGIGAFVRRGARR
ncbi:MAG: hypothetical protein J7507_14755 [Pseudoxanthomonas sp.]|nr:hypothetical protein [Pseudoxanthomonas sp.]